MSSDFDLARAESRGCVFCGGLGLRTVFAPGYDGRPTQFDHTSFVYAARVAATCLCTLGRLIRSRMPEEVRHRTPEIDMICQGRSSWLLDDPTEADWGLDDESIDPTAPASPEAFTAFWRNVRVSRVAKPIP
jgi:hypothetical protein